MKKSVLILIFTCACFYLRAQVNIVTTIAGTGTEGYGGDNGPATNAKFDHPEMICLDNFGNLYIGDLVNNRVRKVTLSTGVITTVAGTGTAGYNGDDIPATNAQLWYPNGICADTSGNIYIGDVLNRRVRKVTAATGIITTIAGTGLIGNSGDGGPATNARISYPSGLSMDKSGNLYIADLDNNNIRKISSSGIITLVAGNGTTGYSGDGNAATNAEMSGPSDVQIDSTGNIFIVDYENNAVRKVDASTGIIITIAGNGTAGYTGDNGPATNAELNIPFGLFIDKKNDIYIADGGNAAFRKIDASTGIISTIAGCGTTGFSGDGGPATAAEFYLPSDISIDGDGTMYLADYLNERIRKVYNTALGVASPRPSPEERVTVYPNPASDELIIENVAGSDFKVYNLLGQEIMSFDKLRMTTNKEVVDISMLIPGSYIIQIIAPFGEIINRRVVVAK